MQPPRQRHKGGALISALFITAIAAIISTALAMQNQLLIHESELAMNADQGYLNCQSLQLYAKNVVKNYVLQWENTKNPPSQFIQLKTKLPAIKIGSMALTGVIDNEQGKFNINDLVYTANQPRFVILLQAVMPGISQQKSYAIAKSLTAWMTTGSDDPLYLHLHPPTISSKQEMTNISELRLVLGITPTIYSALQPYVTALPVAPPDLSPSPPVNPSASPASDSSTPVATVTPIDINAAWAPVLLAADPTLTLEQAQSLVACRNRFGGVVSDMKTFMANCAAPMGVATLQNVAVTSQYFLVQTQAVYGDHQVFLKSFLVTESQKNNKLNTDALKVTTVWQEFE